MIDHHLMNHDHLIILESKLPQTENSENGHTETVDLEMTRLNFVDF